MKTSRHRRRRLHRLAPRRAPPRARRPGRRARRLQRLLRPRAQARQRRRRRPATRPTAWSRATSATARSSSGSSPRSASTPSSTSRPARACARSLTQPVLYEDVNCVGTLRLLEAAVAHGRPRFVFASSSSVYGINSKLPFSEEDPIDRPISPYATTKRAGELHVLQLPPPLRAAGRLPALLHGLRPARSARRWRSTVHRCLESRRDHPVLRRRQARGATTPTSTTSLDGIVAALDRAAVLRDRQPRRRAARHALRARRGARARDRPRGEAGTPAGRSPATCP